jgi:hypothetical protein
MRKAIFLAGSTRVPSSRDSDLLAAKCVLIRGVKRSSNTKAGGPA